jgi:outer membrane protein TolC
MPLGNRADKGALAEADARARQARLSTQAEEQAIAQAVRGQLDALLTTRAAVELAQINLRLAEETLTAERALRQAGRAIQRDVLAAIQAVNDAGVALEKAKADHQLARIELQRLQGSL